MSRTNRLKNRPRYHRQSSKITVLNVGRFSSLVCWLGIERGTSVGNGCAGDRTHSVHQRPQPPASRPPQPWGSRSCAKRPGSWGERADERQHDTPSPVSRRSRGSPAANLQRRTPASSPASTPAAGQSPPGPGGHPVQRPSPGPPPSSAVQSPAAAGVLAWSASKRKFKSRRIFFLWASCKYTLRAALQG